MSEILLEMRKFLAPEYVFGIGARHLAGRYVANLGGARALVVTDAGVEKAGWTRQVIDSLEESGVESAIFSDLSPNPRDMEVMNGAEAYIANYCDSIVAVGGGSPMDCAKGIGVVCSNNKNILEYEGVDNVEVPGPPLVCIPTTSGSSADVSQFAIINDTMRKTKIAIVSKTMVPDAALIDPETTVSMDPELTAFTGLDALTHAIEAYVSNANSPTTDLFALKAIELIFSHISDAVKNGSDINARAGMTLGSLYAGLAFSNAILGAVHAMAHSLGGYLDMPHGLCNAILLDQVINFNYSSCPERYDAILKAASPKVYEKTNSSLSKKEALLSLIKRLKHEVHADCSLSEKGVSSADIGQLAGMAANDPCMSTNPKKMRVEDIVQIYQKAL